MRAQATKLEKERDKQRNLFPVMCTIFDDEDDDDGGGGDGDGQSGPQPELDI